MATLRRSARAASAVAASLAVATLLSCSSGGGVATPVQDVVVDDYVFATGVLQDTGPQCNPPPFSCDPELYECGSRVPLYVGNEWHMHGDVVATGVTSTANFVIAATDLTTKVALALEITVTNFDPAAPAATIQLTNDATYFDSNVECGVIGAGGPESRFAIYDLPVVTLTRVSFAGGAFDPAVPDGSGGFNPAGIFEGTFSFLARTFQVTPSGSLEAHVLVSGCFRVNLPASERGIPVTRTPASSLCP